jgi:hypothetical protein
LNFLDFLSIIVKNTINFLVETVKFEFKRGTWMNQSVTHTYQPPVLETDITDQTSSNADDITHPEQPIPVEAASSARRTARWQSGQALKRALLEFVFPSV